ncbi:hypothetical protein PQQ73_14950 [Paraburkholderia strydomiana]|uniref:Transposase n=1 Tax=Paraburkholderia strydomiana TaxID=1245417 RepID=A0ABW9EF99_9BURK
MISQYAGYPLKSGLTGRRDSGLKPLFADIHLIRGQPVVLVASERLAVHPLDASSGTLIVVQIVREDGA